MGAGCILTAVVLYQGSKKAPNIGAFSLTFHLLISLNEYNRQTEL
jgi:hypothetical protein